MIRTSLRIIRVAPRTARRRGRSPLPPVGRLRGLAVVPLLLASACGPSGDPPAEAPTAASPQAREAAIAAIGVHLEGHRVTEAAAVARRLHEAMPDDPTLAAMLGRIAIAEAARLEGTDGIERRREALRHLSAAIAGGVDDSETLSLAAGLGEFLGSPAEAEPLRRRLAERSASGCEADLSLAWNLSLQGRGEESLAIATEARRRCPELPLAAAMVGELRLAAGDAGGLQDLAAARRLGDGSTAMRIREAAWHRRLGDPSHALLLLAALDEAARRDPAVARELAASHRDLGEPAAAAAALEAALAAHPRRVDLAIAAAEAWREAGDRLRMAAALRHADSIDPRHEAVVRFRQAIGSGDSPGSPTEPPARP